MISLEFLITSLVVVLVPGTGVLYLLYIAAAMTFGVFIFYGCLAHAFRALVIESPRVQDWPRRGFAAAFAGLGVRLAASESSA